MLRARTEFPGCTVGAADFPWRLAAPSWVWPGTMAENCARLQGLFPDVGLLMLESAACLEKEPSNPVPPAPEPELRYHVHLPIDLPWNEGALFMRRVVDAVLDATAHLSPWGFVVHAPPESKLLDELAFAFIDRRIKPGRVLLENTAEFNPLEYWCDVRYLGFNLCLDLGHMLAHSQERLLDVPRVFNRIKLLHLNAPGEDGRHLPLTELDRDGRRLLRRLLDSINPNTVVMLELFNQADLAASMEFLYRQAISKEAER